MTANYDRICSRDTAAKCLSPVLLAKGSTSVSLIPSDFLLDTGVPRERNNKISARLHYCSNTAVQQFVLVAAVQSTEDSTQTTCFPVCLQYQILYNSSQHLVVILLHPRHCTEAFIVLVCAMIRCAHRLMRSVRRSKLSRIRQALKQQQSYRYSHV